MKHRDLSFLMKAERAGQQQYFALLQHMLFSIQVFEWVKNHGGEPIIPFSGVFESKLVDMPEDERDKYCKEVCSSLQHVVNALITGLDNSLHSYAHCYGKPNALAMCRARSGHDTFLAGIDAGNPDTITSCDPLA